MGEIPSFINPNFSPVRIGEGLDTVAYKNSERSVVKVLKRSLTREEGLGIVDRLSNDYRVLKLYLSSYVCDTEFALGEGRIPNTVDIVRSQPYISGVSFYEGMELISSGDKSPDRMIDYLRKTLLLFAETEKIPDIYFSLNKAASGLTRTLSRVNNQNIIVQLDDNSAVPIMVDTSFSRISSSVPIVGDLYRRLAINTVKSLLSTLLS